jgi:hypothetical protein
MTGHGEELIYAEVEKAEVDRARGLNTYLTCMRPALFS